MPEFFVYCKYSSIYLMEVHSNTPIVSKRFLHKIGCLIILTLLIAIGKKKCLCPSQGYSQLSTDKTKALNSLLPALTDLFFSSVKE